MTEEIEYPIRINRYLFLKHYSSRREADRLIEKGKIKINGKIAVLGQKILQTDTVEVAKEVINRQYKYFIFNKPIGVVSHNPQVGETSVEDVSGLGNNVSPVGRLDKNSEGLMLLTDDGRIVNFILNPDYAHEREYEVRVNKYIKESDLKKLSKGVDIEGYITKPATVKRLNEDSFTLIIKEGKKHQIRRMCAALGYNVINLKRTRMMNITLDIKTGENRPLNENEIKMLFSVSNII